MARSTETNQVAPHDRTVHRDLTGGLTAPLPVAGMPIADEVDLTEVTRERFWSIVDRTAEAFFLGQLEGDKSLRTFMIHHDFLSRRKPSISDRTRLGRQLSAFLRPEKKPQNLLSGPSPAFIFRS